MSSLTQISLDLCCRIMNNHEYLLGHLTELSNGKKAIL